MSATVRALILDKRAADELAAPRRAQGMRTLREAGLEKVARGRDLGSRGPARARRLAPPSYTPAARRADACAASSSASSERLQLDAERQLDQAVGQPDVLRQQRPVQVGADHVAPCARPRSRPCRCCRGPSARGRAAARRRRGRCGRRGSRSRRSRAARLPRSASIAQLPIRRGPGSRTVRRSTRPTPGSSSSPICVARGRAAGSRRRRRARPRRAPRRRAARRASSRPCPRATAAWSRSWPPPM